MPSFLLVLLAGPETETGRAREAIATAHALLASGMAEKVELLLSGAGVDWLARLAAGAEEAAPLRSAQEAGVVLKACTRAASERGVIDTFDALPEVIAAGAPTLIASRASAGWTLLTF
ncbi:MAG: DsrE family protein [Deltaproteobacteria bacterium]|nr:DsrE family protein [Deltaproteobacteria bacterium]